MAAPSRATALRVTGLLTCLLGLSCANGSDDGTAGDEMGDEGQEGPSITGLTVTPAPHNHLAAELRFETSQPALVSVRLSDDEGRARVFEGGQTPSTEHLVAVFGMRAEVPHELEIVATDDLGATASLVETHTPAPLPPDFPPLEVSGVAGGDPMGWTFFNVYRWVGRGLDGNWGLLLAVDDQGRVVWYRRRPTVGDMEVTPQGRVIALTGDQEIVEYDLLGEERHRLLAADMDDEVEFIHHEVISVPGEDGYWTMGSELRYLDDVPDGMGGTTTSPVVGDRLIRVTADGHVIHNWSLFDLLPGGLERITPYFFGPFWDPLYVEQVPEGGTRDWSHGNAVLPVPAWNAVIASFRHLDWIVAVEADSGELRWRLGPDGDFTLTEGAWFYHAHAPEVGADGRLLVYDNGVFRPGTGFEAGDAPPYSRVVEYAIDEQNMRATETWSWTASPPRYAPILGDADRLPGGNVLVTDGGLVERPEDDLAAPDNMKYGVIEEIDGGTGEAIFTVEIGGPETATSFSVYRADRIFPDPTWVTE